MSVLKFCVVAAVILAGTGSHAWADGILGGSMRWTTWSPRSGTLTFSNGYPVPVVAAAQPAPVAAQAVAAPVAMAPARYDGYVNVSTGPFPASDSLTTGNVLPWTASPQVAALFGGPPTAQQQVDFGNAVLARAQQTFALAGVPVSLTADPNAAAAHTLSVISGASSVVNGQDIGLTQVGGNGVDFIDRVATSAHSVDQLEWIVAHNVAHELMLAFGVGENYDNTGKFIDAPNASWSMMTSPTATFSPDAAAALRAANFQAGADAGLNGQQTIAGQPVPEPATLALWSVAALALACRARRLRRRAA